MLLRLRRSASASELDAISGLSKELGYTSRFLDGDRELLELVGGGAPSHRSRFEDLSGVAAVLDAGDAIELHQRARGQEDTVVAIGAARFGGGWASLIAGPCAVEDRERTLEIAHAVRAAGGALLRGGVYKPRTSPYSFRGLGARGLDILVEAREATGLSVVTEVLDPRDVGAVGAVADAFQIGSRSMSNAPLLTEIGQFGKPVLLKRGRAATVRDFLLAAEYVLATGNERLVLCERGVRGFDSVTRGLLDLGAVAHLKLATHLPVVVDPSHAAGRAELVPALARAGVAAGADGLLVEVHPEPAETHSDGRQAVSPSTLQRIGSDLRALLSIDGRALATVEPDRALERAEERS